MTMSPLLKIRAERDQMSAIERRIADFILENAHLLRDYSSQQLANALGISQSSVVKFSQKLGFKGYPDLKFSVGEAVARGERQRGTRHHHAVARATRSRRSPRTCGAASRSPKRRRASSTRPSRSRRSRARSARRQGLHHRPRRRRPAGARVRDEAGAAGHSGRAPRRSGPDAPGAGFRGDGRCAGACFPSTAGSRRCARWRGSFDERRGKVVSVTRHSANPLRAQADTSLLVSAHDERPHIEPLLYQAALQHLLDLLFVLLCRSSERIASSLSANVKRSSALTNP